MLVASNVLCNKCVESLLPSLVPEDVGLEIENSTMGPMTFSFLHVEISTRVPTNNNNSFFDVKPILHNERFAFREDKYPRVAKLELFMGRRTAMFDDLRPFVFARLIAFETVLGCQSIEDPFVFKHSVRSLVALSLEVLRLRWPLRWLANAIIGFPLYRKSWFAASTRKFGFYLRHSCLLGIWCSDSSDAFYTFDAEVELGVLAERALADNTSGGKQHRGAR
jgi:hypothetical protein